MDEKVQSYLSALVAAMINGDQLPEDPNDYFYAARQELGAHAVWRRLQVMIEATSEGKFTLRRVVAELTSNPDYPARVVSPVNVAPQAGAPVTEYDQVLHRRAYIFNDDNHIGVIGLISAELAAQRKFEREQEDLRRAEAAAGKQKAQARFEVVWTYLYNAALKHPDAAVSARARAHLQARDLNSLFTAAIILDITVKLEVD